MNLKFTPTSIFLAFGLAGISSQGTAQCTLANAVADITLQCAGVGNTRTGVAYYPTKNRYYSVVAGTTNYPIETFAASGGAALSSSVQTGDYRGLWYNPLLGTIEGNTFNGVGIFSQNIDPVTGYVTGTATNLLSGTMPNSQSCGVYDAANDQVLYYNGGNLYKHSRSTGLQISTIAITGLPAGNINLYSLGYTGVSGREVCLYDYTNQAVRFINLSNGAYVSSCQLPASAPVPGSYRMGYANNRIFLYDQSVSRWYGYKVTDQPDILFSGNNIVCSGASLNLVASGAGAYLWSNGSTAPVISAAASTSTMYGVVATSTSGCTSASNFFFTVNPSPTVTATASKTLICEGDTTTISASGASSYTWSANAIIAPSTTVDPIFNTTYSVIGAAANGCMGMGTVAITVELLPVVSATATQTLLCLGESTTLTASGASTYTWSEGPNVTTTLILTPSVTTIYTVTGASANGCTGASNVSTVSILVVPLPTVAASAANSVVCLGEVVTMTATGAGNYTWTPGNVANSGTLLVTPTASTLYQVTGKDSNGCQSSSSVAISVELCTGLGGSSNTHAALNVYPNPNNGNFTLKGNTALELNIVNHLGQLVKTVQLNGTSHECQVSDLAEGIYFLVPAGASESSTLKLVVSH